ncbi:RNA exonuclease 3 [Toensbergia leucococca]|nr:RNA exonuclease 3 [Toensbergia leucococca]
MFSSVGLFKNVNCPEISCYLPNCIFAHNGPIDREDATASTSQSTESREHKSSEVALVESDRARKKRRIDSPARDDDTLMVQITTNPPKELQPKNDTQAIITRRSTGAGKYSESQPPTTATINITPPPLRSHKAGALDDAATTDNIKAGKLCGIATKKNATVPQTKTVKESLNPRLLHNPPAPHAIRLAMITMLHEHMTRLNEEVKKCDDPCKTALELSAQDLIGQVLGEEEKAAKENPSVYSNIVKLRIVALKKMKLPEWKIERLKQTEKEYPEATVSSVPKATILDTGLSSLEEVMLLPKLVARQENLDKHGYVPSLPSEAEIAEVKKGVETSQGWEQCDRCMSRFQVFPGRRTEDGALTTGGSCVYHYAKPLRPTKEKAGTGHRESTYPCCNQSVGTSIGCTTADTHVFKISQTKRLAMVLAFKKTPAQKNKIVKGPVCFDCEMGYTTIGMELIRLTATSWPSGQELLDVLVRPLGEILDLNSRFSGVWPQHFAEAIPYHTPVSGEKHKTETSGTIEVRLRLADSPEIARDLLFEHLNPDTPLIGHALENDLNATRIIHPTIVDTVLLYPHPRGLPIRFGLKMLVKKYLNRNIQMGGAQGHDSKEDARAAGDLVRLKVAETWKAMIRDGWTVSNGIFYPPLALGTKPPKTPRASEGGTRPRGLIDES